MRGFAGVVGLAFVLSCAPAQAQEGTIESVHLDKHARLSGTCHPTHVHFSGKITTGGPAFVTYRWLRSDGKHRDQALQFSEGSGRTVGTDWDQTSTASGWVQLIVLSPKRVESARTHFEVHCGA